MPEVGYQTGGHFGESDHGDGDLQGEPLHDADRWGLDLGVRGVFQQIKNFSSPEKWKFFQQRYLL